MKDLYQVLRITSRDPPNQILRRSRHPRGAMCGCFRQCVSSFGVAYVFFFRFSPTVGTFG